MAIDGIVRAYAADLRHALGDDLRRLSLYGSRARGDADPASDYDLLVVLRRRDGALKDRVYDLGGRYLAEHLVDISARVVPEAEYERLRASALPFWHNLVRDEVVLWPPPSS